MIIRRGRRDDSFLRRIFRTSKAPSQERLLTPEEFQHELQREMYRSDRRSGLRDFSLIRIRCDQKVFEALMGSEVMLGIPKRLRISDSIGWFDDSLAILLPETAKEGALEVANAIARITFDEGINVDTEVSVYPWDDDIVSLAKELREKDSDESDNDTQPPSENGKQSYSNGNGKSQGSEAEPVTGGNRVSMQRYDFVRRRPTPWWKRAVDIFGAGTGLVILSPVLLFAAIAIKVTSKGPVFFKQIREGKDGQNFGILKFRTMITNAEDLQQGLREYSEQDGPAFKLKDDPRITLIGKYLRKSCIDELPQLINILCGDMSLVGPRPLPVVESHACTAWQRARLAVLPGLTCTWQVRGGRDIKFAEWMRMDLDYIEQRSFWFDLKLIVETAFIALLHRGSV